MARRMDNPVSRFWRTALSLAPELDPRSWVPGTVRCRVPADLAEVESISPEEIESRAADADAAAVEAVWEATRLLYRSGIHPAVQLCVRRHGHVILDRSLGHVRGNGPDDPPDAKRVLVSPATPFNIFSASKAITATVVHLLIERGLIDLDARACEYIPEFAARGKEGITIRHLLSHRAGIPALPPEQMRPEKMMDAQETVRAICDLEPSWRPGQLAYHAVTGAYLLAEIARRVSGRNVREILGGEILRPLGFRWMNYGVAARDLPKVARNYFTGVPPPAPLAMILYRGLGVDFQTAAEDSNSPGYMTGVLPAANVITTANELSRFFEILLNEGELDGVRLFDPATVRRATEPQGGSFFEFDGQVVLPLRYGLGFMLGGERVGLFGSNAARAFGHLGYMNMLCWADPERQITAALMTSGKPILYPEIFRFFDVVRQIGLAFPKTPARSRPRRLGRGRRVAVRAAGSKRRARPARGAGRG